jgi:hypothetical protein
MSEYTKEWLEIVVIVVIGVVSMFIASLATNSFITEAIRRDAINAGVAEHYIDADQNKAFRWKTNHVLEAK